MTDLMPGTTRSTEDLRAAADRHLWRHFAEIDEARRSPLPIMISGEGCHVTDSEGKRYIDGISCLFCVNLGYSFGAEIGEAAAAQLSQLGYYAGWSTANEPLIALAEKVASLAPEGLDRVFFTPSGGESNEAAWKLAREYYSLRGQRRWKAISRNGAYHGTTMGALSLTGIAPYRTMFEPLVPDVGRLHDTNRFRRPAGETEEEFTAYLLADLEHQIVSLGADTVALVILEPVQNQGGCLTPPEGYFAGVRALCDTYDILLLADEVITGFGRLGAWFASELYDIKPDLISIGKGLSSTQAAISAVVASDKVVAPFETPGTKFHHGNTFGGHPTMCAIALRNIEIMEREGIMEHVSAKQHELREHLATLLPLPIVGDLRGTGFFYAIELVRDKATNAPFTEEEGKALFSERLEVRLREEGLLCRAADEGSPVIFIAPPLVADTAEFQEITGILRRVLTDLSDRFAALAS
jgi:adenosylmethionine-8-amino-7-oxononanoate aminotransferase